MEQKERMTDIAVKYLANLIKEELLFKYDWLSGKPIKKDLSDEDKKYYTNLIADFSNDVKEELIKILEEREKANLFCDGTFYYKPLDKFFVKKYFDIYNAMPTHVKIEITKNYVCDGNYCCAPYEKFYVACSKEYMKKEIDYFEHAKEHGYAFGDEERCKERWEQFLEKCDGDFYVQEEYKDND